MLQGLNGWHLVIILAVVLLLFGAPKLPGLARSLGQSMRIFRSEVKTMKEENGTETVDNAEVEVETPKTVQAAPKTTTKSTTKPKS
jgi:sec-independent protein translocase protein TatA